MLLTVVEDYALIGDCHTAALVGIRWRMSWGGSRKALLRDYIVLGGGKFARLRRLPPHTRRGDNAYVFVGGFRLWERLPLGIFRTIADAGDWQNPVVERATA